MTPTHIVSIYDEELKYLTRRISEMGGTAEQMVGDSVRALVNTNVALAQKVIDYLATDLADLLRQLDGKTLQAGGVDQTLATAGAPLISHAPDWRTRLLAVITNPSVALILMMIGVYGLIFELANPGMALPGVLGGICLLLGLYALQLLPVSYAGMGLILLGLMFMVGEAFVPSFGILGIGGVVAFVIGALILVDTDVPGFGIPLALIVGIATVSALF